MALQRRAVVLQLAAAAPGGYPTAGRCRLTTATHYRQTHQIPCAEHEMSIFLFHLMPSLPVCLRLIHLGYSDSAVFLPSHLLGPAGVIWDLGSV